MICDECFKKWTFIDYQLFTIYHTQKLFVNLRTSLFYDQAVTWYREGKMNELIAYCRDDVDLTRRLYEFGKQNGYVFYLDRLSGEKRKVPVDW